MSYRMEGDSGLRFTIQTHLMESKEKLNRNLDIEATLQSVACLLPGKPGIQNYNLPYDDKEASACFMKYFYSDWLVFLCQSFSVEFFKSVPQNRSTVLLDIFFLHGEDSESFLVLTNSVASASGYQLHKCVSLLEAFLRAGHLCSVIWKQCSSLKDLPSKIHGAPTCESVHNWPQLVTAIVSLPDRVLNKLQMEASPFFCPETYIPLITRAMWQSLQKVHNCLENNKDSSLQFLSQLLGKLCISGHAEIVWNGLLPDLLQEMSKSHIWSCICEKLITSVPDRCMESVVTALLLHLPWYGIVTKMLGHSVLTNNKLQYLLTNKLLLLRHFSQDIILQNIIGHLADSMATRAIFIKVLKSLLSVWGDKSAVRHTTYDQHLYISKAILVCIAFLNIKDSSDVKQDVLQKLMTGVQSHLESPIFKVRRLGMVVAEQLTWAVGPQYQKLQFEYEKDEEVEALLLLVVPPPEPTVDQLTKKLSETTVKYVTEEKALPSDSKPGVSKTNSDSELDSDDDLEPYDLSNDVKTPKVKAPVYLRDCMEGLISSEDPDKLEASLASAEKLICQHAAVVHEIAVEFCKLLLCLQDNFNTLHFYIQRHSAMVALLVTSPQKVAEYLTSEFYERNYNIRQRLDMLEVLSSGAQELSQPPSNKHPTQQQSLPSHKPATSHSSNHQDWQQIIQQRLETKTRRFGKGHQKPEPAAAENRFGPVAGYFFFPLLRNFDRAEATFDLLGEDHLVLGRLLHTLGIIIYAALHTPIVRQMAASLLEFIWNLRYHPQPAVRQSLLFALSMTILAVPSHMLISDFSAEMTEAREWLEDVVHKDTDKECQTLAIQNLVLLENTLKKEFETT